MKWLFILFTSFLLLSCASKRTQVSCAEIEYRLNAMNYSSDQRYFLEQELKDCRHTQKEQEKDDVITNKIKGSIYEQFNASKKDSAKTEVKTDSLTKAHEI